MSTAEPTVIYNVGVHDHQFSILNNGQMLVTCTFCRKDCLISPNLPLDNLLQRLDDWINDGNVLCSVLPHLAPSDIELLISGTCPECYELMFPPPTDEDQHEDQLSPSD